MIISGAGLPLGLPGYVGDSDISLIPIVSSARTFNIICRRWQNSLPSAAGRRGGGGDHGGRASGVFPGESCRQDRPDAGADGGRRRRGGELLHAPHSRHRRRRNLRRPGHRPFSRLGASGVQMATRFVCTDECDVHENFKRAYLDARQEDITIINSPVGLPGRVIDNDFVASIKQGKTVPFNCKYHCLRTCDPHKAPYCIAEVLTKAAQGKLDESFAFAGSNAYRCHEIVPVKTLVETLTAELAEALARAAADAA